MRKVMIVALVLALAAGGLSTWWSGSKSLHETLAAHWWTQTSCHIERSEARYVGPRGKRKPQHEFVITYAYSAEGTPRVAHEVHSGLEQHLYQPNAEALAKRFPVGARVDCYFDPEAPTSAVLDRRVGLWDLEFIPFGLGFLLPGALVLRRRGLSEFVDRGTRRQPSTRTPGELPKLLLGGLLISVGLVALLRQWRNVAWFNVEPHWLHLSVGSGLLLWGVGVLAKAHLDARVAGYGLAISTEPLEPQLGARVVVEALLRTPEEVTGDWVLSVRARDQSGRVRFVRELGTVPVCDGYAQANLPLTLPERDDLLPSSASVEEVTDCFQWDWEVRSVVTSQGKRNVELAEAIYPS